MRDFTVRGWRVANVEGIEELFANPKTAVEPQKDVKIITYEETKLGIKKNTIVLKILLIMQNCTYLYVWQKGRLIFYYQFF